MLDLDKQAQVAAISYGDAKSHKESRLETIVNDLADGLISLSERLKQLEADSTAKPSPAQPVDRG